MITVLESIKLSTQYLSEKGIESSRTNAELLLADIIGCKRLDLYLAFERPLSENEIEKYREYIKRRGMFEPLQYIIEEVEFYGLKLKVNNSVLIPRPETELLVEHIINRFPVNKKMNVLDIGCGSGNISIALAVHFPEIEVIATDISDEALQIAEQNCRSFNVINRVRLIRHNILKEDLSDFPQYELIISNPPYVSKENYTSLQKEIRDYEPRNAVTDDDDGFTFYREITNKAFVKLNSKGMLYFEMAQGQSNTIAEIMSKHAFTNVGIIKDYQNIDRIIFGEKN